MRPVGARVRLDATRGEVAIVEPCLRGDRTKWPQYQGNSEKPGIALQWARLLVIPAV
jgi:hypothetical protein